jgi:hypothetical protein
MKFDEIDESIDKIVAIVAKVPDEFKGRTFDALLTAALAEVRGIATGRKAAEQENDTHDNGASDHDSQADTNNGAPAKAKGRFHQFLRDKGITEAEVRKIVELEGREVVFYRTPNADVKAGAQIKWALLLALASGLDTGNLTVSSDAVRKKVQDEKIYDAPNFAKTFKLQKANFVGAMGNGDPARRLSADGEDALAALIKAMAA